LLTMRMTDRSSDRASETQRLQLRVTGIVQGVGFRPFIHNLAARMQLTGNVRNDSRGVLIEIQGPQEKLESFVAAMEDEKPPLARIETVQVSEIESKPESAFRIEKSRSDAERFVLISPDIATCEDCLREMRDPADRRYRYAFINCTNCGPRFTIIRDVPYDRKRTTMDVFGMCSECRREYEDPSNRRFHAQPNACAACGPSLRLAGAGREPLACSDPLTEAARLLREGKIIALKGLGGFHLACDAGANSVVAELRRRKNREEKPLAIMVSGIERVREICFVSPEEERLLLGPERPIVLLRKKAHSRVAEAVAPGNLFLGVMLPYTGLHHLLLHEFGGELVMTSGNLSEEPLAFTDDEAFRRLGPIADFFLLHDREIYMRCDDSVSRVFKGRAMLLRRSRGYAPGAVRLPGRLNKVILACGGHLKNTFAFGKNEWAIMSHHIGDLENAPALDSYTEAVEHYSRVFHLEPELVAHDLHPDYLSTAYALSRGEETVAVQHHHAHVAACMAEHGLQEPVIGVAFDGVGYGDDGKLWGGEFLECDYSGYRRIGRFAYFPLPGGEAAVREPWRMGAVFLHAAFGDEFEELPLDFVRRLDRGRWRVLKQMVFRRVNCPEICSAGRWFDAVSALVTGIERQSFEGQAAIALEMGSRKETVDAYPYGIQERGDGFVVDPLPMLRAIVDELLGGTERDLVGGKFHFTLADIVARGCSLVRERSGLEKVALSGGCFQNVILLERTVEKLTSDGFEVYIHHQVPPNDGGLSLGQVMVAASKKGQDGVYRSTGTDHRG